MNKYTFHIEVTNRVTNETLELVIVASGNNWFDAWHSQAVSEVKHKDAYKYEIFQIETVKQ